MKSVHIAPLLILVALVTGFGLLTNTQTGSKLNAVTVWRPIYVKELPPLPAECKKVTDTCWQESTSSGSIKFIGQMAVYKK